MDGEKRTLEAKANNIAENGILKLVVRMFPAVIAAFGAVLWWNFTDLKASIDGSKTVLWQAIGKISTDQKEITTSVGLLATQVQVLSRTVEDNRQRSDDHDQVLAQSLGKLVDKVDKATQKPNP